MEQGFAVQEVRNDKGEPIVLTAREVANAKYCQEIVNNLGFEIPITTLTAIQKRIVEQKFFTVRPSLYVPVAVGNGAFSSNLLTYLDYQLAGDFETGVINTGANSNRLAEADAGVDSITIPVINWAKGISYDLIQLQMAAKAGNWDLVSSKERSRKKNWDLGIQKVAFVGLPGTDAVRGLFNQANVNANTMLITGYIKDMSPTDFQTFLAGLLGDYQSNNAFTAMPSHFVIPQIDFNGLITSVDETFPLKSRLERIRESMKEATGNPNFQVLGNAYADQVNNAAYVGLNKNMYALYNYDEDSLRMDIPVEYVTTVQNTVNGFNFQNAGYGQFTGAKAYRPLEMLYFTWAA